MIKHNTVLPVDLVNNATVYLWYILLDSNQINLRGRTMQNKIKELEQQLEQKKIEMNSIQQIGKALSSELRTTRLLPLIMKEVTRLMHAERSTFYIVDQERGELWSQIAQQAEITEIRLKIGVGIAGHVAKTGEVINIPDAYNDDRFDPTTDKKTGYHTRSILCMPIFEPHNSDAQQPEIIGVLQVLNKIDGVFTSDDEDLLSSMASQIAIAIINARLYASLEKKVSELDLLFSIERELNKIIDKQELLQWLTAKIAETLKVDLAMVALFDGNDSGFNTMLSNRGEVSEEMQKGLFALEEVQHVLDVKELLVLNNFGDQDEKHARLSALIGSKVKHFACMPLQIDDKIIGVMPLFNKLEDNDYFRMDDQKLIRSLSSQISRSLETYRLREEKIKADRLASIGNMMSTIVHDLRTPINNIQGFVELMQEEDDEELREEFSGIIHEQITTLTNMTKDVLDFAKGKTSILPVKYPVDKLITQFAKVFEQDVVKKGYRFEAVCDTASMVYVDPERMNRVFMNIMKNALEAMKPGGTFSIHAKDRDGEVVFSLSDTGQGIPEEIRDNLFEEFVTSGKEGGTGLGLAIVKKMVDQHKGRIEVESEVGKGTTFKIYLKRL